MDCSMPIFSVPHYLWSLCKLMSIESMMLSNHLILHHPLLLLPSIFTNIRIFSNELALSIRWPQYNSFSISPCNEYSELISFLIDWFDLSAVQGTLESLLQHHSFKVLILPCSALCGPTLTSTHDYVALIRLTIVGKVMSLPFNMWSRFAIAFLSRSKCLLISWLQSPSTVILKPKKIKSFTVFIFFTICWPWSDGTKFHDVHFLNIEFQAGFFTLLFHLHQEAL